MEFLRYLVYYFNIVYGLKNEDIIQSLIDGLLLVIDDNDNYDEYQALVQLCTVIIYSLFTNKEIFAALKDILVSQQESCHYFDIITSISIILNNFNKQQVILQDQQQHYMSQQVSKQVLQQEEEFLLQ